MRAQHWMWIGLVGLVSAGCGKSTTDLPLTDFSKEFSTAFCSQLFKCCDPTELTELGGSTWTNESGCMTTYSGITTQYFITPIQNTIAAGRGRYDPKKGAACLAAFKKLGCSGSNDMLAFFETCEDFYVGTQAAEAACHNALECVDNHVCVKLAGQDTGTCKALLAKDATCQVNIQPYCVAGLYCDPATTKCVEQKGESAPCADAYECKTGLECNGTTCVKRPVVCDGK